MLRLSFIFISIFQSFILFSSGTNDIYLSLENSNSTKKAYQVTSYQSLLMGFTDYSITYNNTQEQLILRTYSEDLQKNILPNMPKQVIHWDEKGFLNGDIMNSINQNRQSLYVLEKHSNGWKNIKIDEVLYIKQTTASIYYQGNNHSFEYFFNKSYEPAQDLRTNFNLPGGAVFFIEQITENNEKLNIFRCYDGDYSLYTDIYISSKGIYKLERGGESLTQVRYLDVPSVTYPIKEYNTTNTLKSNENKASVKEYEMKKNADNSTETVASPNPQSKVQQVNQQKNPLQTHKVKKGENLYQIALSYKTTLSKLMEINHLSSYDLKENQELIIE